MQPSFLRSLLAASGALVFAMSAISAQEPSSSPPPSAKPDDAPQEATVKHLKRIGLDNQSIAELARPTQATGELTMLAPFALPIFIVAIVAFARYRRTQALHETLRLMVEKGVAIPPELLVPPKPASNDFRRGTLLVGFGVGLSCCLALLHARGAWSLGLVPLLLGLGYLVVAKLGTNPPAGPGPTIPA